MKLMNKNLSNLLDVKEKDSVRENKRIKKKQNQIKKPHINPLKKKSHGVTKQYIRFVFPRYRCKKEDLVMLIKLSLRRYALLVRL